MQHQKYLVLQALRAIAEAYPQPVDFVHWATEQGWSERTVRRSFERWVGVTPQRFAQFLTLQHARERLQHASVLETSLDLQLSGSARLHDLFLRWQGMTPGEFRRQGVGMALETCRIETELGEAVVIEGERGITALGFSEPGQSDATLLDLKKRLPQAHYQSVAKTPSAPTLAQLLAGKALSPQASLSLCMTGTAFQLQVWEALLRIPSGCITSYSRLAQSIGRPTASRAVATAIGHNKIAALIPCHRVLRESGLLGGYRWGLAHKLALLGQEAVANMDEF